MKWITLGKPMTSGRDAVSAGFWRGTPAKSHKHRPSVNRPTEPSFSGSRVISGGAAPPHTPHFGDFVLFWGSGGRGRGKEEKFSAVLSWCSQKRLTLNPGAHLTRKSRVSQSTVWKPRMSLCAVLFSGPKVALGHRLMTLIDQWLYAVRYLLESPVVVFWTVSVNGIS